jgi:hypothetical protein
MTKHRGRAFSILAGGLLASLAAVAACSDSGHDSARSSMTARTSVDSGPSNVEDVERAAAEATVDCRPPNGQKTCDEKNAVATCEDAAGRRLFLVPSEAAIPQVTERFKQEFHREYLRHHADRQDRMPLAWQTALKDVEFPVVGTFRYLGYKVGGPRPSEPIRPAPIGTSIAPAKADPGTLGCRVRDKQGRVFLLSNAHVLAPGDQEPGYPIHQPADDDSGSKDRLVARLSAWHNPDPRSPANLIDAAIACTTETCVGTRWPDGKTGPSPMTVAAKPGWDAIKYGRTTGSTDGVVLCVDAAVCVEYDECMRFEKQIILAGREQHERFCDDGDSGSLIMKPPGNEPLGLLFARNWLRVRSEQQTFVVENACLANPIDAVLARWNLTIDDAAADTTAAPCEVPNHNENRCLAPSGSVAPGSDPAAGSDPD